MSLYQLFFSYNDHAFLKITLAHKLSPAKVASVFKRTYAGRMIASNDKRIDCRARKNMAKKRLWCFLVARKCRKMKYNLKTKQVKLVRNSSLEIKINQVIIIELTLVKLINRDLISKHVELI